MPAIIRGKTGGIKQFIQGNKSYQTTYNMGKDQNNCVTFDLWIVGKYKKGKRNQQEFNILLMSFIYHLLN
ncbi:MAG UNVERIFIED_CONTAM: hypothetical protein LVR29_26995 [Microcystis novacekii LVE1205-3]|jgi:putative transposase